MFAQPGLNAGRRIKTEAGTTGKHDGIDLLNQPVGGQAFGVATGRRPAHDGNRTDGWLFEQQRGHARNQRLATGMADTDAGNIRDVVVHRGLT